MCSKIALILQVQTERPILTCLLLNNTGVSNYETSDSIIDLPLPDIDDIDNIYSKELIKWFKTLKWYYKDNIDLINDLNIEKTIQINIYPLLEGESTKNGFVLHILDVICGSYIIISKKHKLYPFLSFDSNNCIAHNSTIERVSLSVIQDLFQMNNYQLFKYLPSSLSVFISRVLFSEIELLCDYISKSAVSL